jgi:hypothetical protein
MILHQVHPESGGGVHQTRARKGADRPLEDDLREVEQVHQRRGAQTSGGQSRFLAKNYVFLEKKPLL